MEAVWKWNLQRLSLEIHRETITLEIPENEEKTSRFLLLLKISAFESGGAGKAVERQITLERGC